MDAVLKLRDTRQASMYRHPLFSWMDSTPISCRDRLNILPVLANFSMGFRDINKWVLRYPAAQDSLERAINIHTFEDETHSRLYLEDWTKLRLDDALNWRASDTLSWLFLSESTRALREHGMYFLRMAVEDRADPVLRFAQSEVIEACGKVFFDNIEKIATRATLTTGVEYRYLGRFHLMRESGHVETEGVFERIELDQRRRERAIDLTDCMFDIFESLFSCFLEYAKNYVELGRTPDFERGCSISAAAPATAVLRSAHGSWTGKLVARYPDELREALDVRKRKTARHPFYIWLRTTNELSAAARLRRFMPMWAMDILGYADLNRYVFRYRYPNGAFEHAVNRWVDDLRTHNVLYLRDWQNLGMDEALGWRASETLNFYYLDPWMDTHRRNIVRFVELTSHRPNPALRLWLMYALESSGEAFFENTKAIALAAEREVGIRLDYLADRHDLVHPTLPPDELGTHPGAVEPYLNTDDRAAAIDMVNAVFDSVDEQLNLSLDAAVSNRFRLAK